MTFRNLPTLPHEPESSDFKRRLDNHFAMCSAFAGAAALLSASTADAAIVYSGTKNVAVPVNNAGLFIDLDTGAFSTTEEIAGFDLNFSGTHGGGSGSLKFTGGDADADGAVATITVHGRTQRSSSSSSSSSSPGFTTVAVNKLKAGDAISGTSKFGATGPLGAVSSSSSSSSTQRSGAWGHGGTGYVGFRFVSAANVTLYGWAQLTVGADLRAKVVDWGYEDSGKAITAGQTSDTLVTVQVKQATTTEGGGAPAKIRLVRTGDRSAPLTVNYVVRSTSTAVGGADYEALSGTATIAAGKKAVTVQVNANDNATRDGTRTVSVKVVPGAGYSVGKPKGGVVKILDND